MKTYTYHINLDERGIFYADVRDQRGTTVFEINAGHDLDESNIFDDGFMRNKKDLAGLHEYLVDMGIMNSDDKLI